MTPRNSFVTVTDQFCGAGGSSIGARRAGAEIRLALNHWKLAVETHNTNFPNTMHDCTDVSACDPRRYPSTDILITSPECTNHSLAKGKMRKYQQQLEMFGTVQIDPSEERSRATMWDVCRFAETHHYRIVIVENVVEARWWPPFEAWLHAMELLDYNYQIVYLNSMHAHPTPQSRDRMYVVFSKKSLRMPDLRITPAAYCEQCGHDVASVQSWKNPAKPWGKYKAQYVYRCPDCANEVTPYYHCAANAIDWSIPAPRIGDRSRPLKEKTIKRIELGLQKFGRQPQLVANYSPGYTMPITSPAGTVTSADHHALLTPPFLVDLAYTHGHDSRATEITKAASTQTSQQTQALVVPPFLVSVNHSTDRVRSIDEAMPTAMPQGNPALVTPFIVKLRGDEFASGMHQALGTVTAGGVHHALCLPFLSSYYGTGGNAEIIDAMPTLPTRDRHSLVVPPFLMGIHKATSYRKMTEVMSTVVGEGNHHFLAQPGAELSVDDCGFRMLQPHEIGAAMAFPPDYKVLGTQRDQVKQYGNAVTPPAMDLLAERCLAVLG